MAHKAIFLDRDDTLVDDPGYIQSPEQIRLLPGAAQALVMLKRMGYLLIVVTNQSGVARGMITEEQLVQIHEKFRSLLAAENAWLDGLYYCPYHPDGEIKDFSIESNLRKPNAGMLFQAEEDHDIDLEQSWMIGDSYRDIRAGKAAGCHTILVDVPGKIREKKPGDPEPDRKAVNLREAVNIIRMHEFHQKAHSVKRSSVQNSEQSAESTDTEPAGLAFFDNFESSVEPDRPQTLIEEYPEETPPTAVYPEPEIETPTEDEIEVEEPEPIQPEPEPEKVFTAKNRPPIEPPQNNDLPSEVHPLLEEIAHRLRSKDREGLYQEFSVFKLLSLMIQVIAIFCLIVSICFWLSPKTGNEPVLIMIGYAIGLQVLVITLLMMHSKD